MTMAKTKLITIGNNTYELRPARARSHYLGANNTGGTPYAFSATGKRAAEAWFVVGRASGKVLGVIEEAYREYGFLKVAGDGLPKIASIELAAQGSELKAGGLYYELSRRIYSGNTISEAIANGLGLRH